MAGVGYNRYVITPAKRRAQHKTVFLLYWRDSLLSAFVLLEKFSSPLSSRRLCKENCDTDTFLQANQNHFENNILSVDVNHVSQEYNRQIENTHTDI